MVTTIGVVLGGPRGDGGFIDAAVSAAERVSAAEVRVDLRPTPPPQVDPTWDAVLCHGVQLAAWLADHRPSIPAVLTDLPADRSGLDGVTLVDWAWDEAAYCAGVLAAELAGGRPVGLVAGPPVLTQRRVSDAFAAGTAERVEARGAVEVHSVFLPGFADLAAGARAGALLAGPWGCAVVAHSADAAGEHACAAARELGVPTIGFLTEDVAHLAVVRSDVPGVVELLLGRLAAGAALPATYRCGFASGHLSLHIGDGVGGATREVVDSAVRRVTDGGL